MPTKITKNKSSVFHMSFPNEESRKAYLDMMRDMNEIDEDGLLWGGAHNLSYEEEKGEEDVKEKD